jgi:fructosamine-3-kinase
MPADDLRAALRGLGIDAADVAGRAVAGGSISETRRVDTSDGPILLKLEAREASDRLDCEADGLAALRRTNTVAVPEVLARGTAGRHAFLAIEWIELGAKTRDAERRLGAALASMHSHGGDSFGWQRDNYIGRTSQPNGTTSSWPEFFREKRLRHQLDLARRNGIGGDVLDRAEALLCRLDDLFDGHSPAPSLLHGDLWGGNWGADADGTPYIFDPAVYYGDREADIAMTRLFGGFGAEFQRAYDEAWPPAPGRDRRTDLYNLYHLLNHFNLFGGGYRAQVLACIERLRRR